MIRILIVEDDPLMSKMYENIFTLEGFEVVIAQDGESGLEKVKISKPALIILDIMMPKLNGLQVLDKLKMSEATKNIPVVMLTNLASQKDAENALLKGAVKYIVKSEQTPKVVVNMIREILAGYTRNESIAAAT